MYDFLSVICISTTWLHRRKGYLAWFKMLSTASCLDLKDFTARGYAVLHSYQAA
jgi:hypothetical protein